VDKALCQLNAAVRCRQPTSAFEANAQGHNCCNMSNHTLAVSCQAAGLPDCRDLILLVALVITRFGSASKAFLFPCIEQGVMSVQFPFELP
jgi:hypothetical protein